MVMWMLSKWTHIGGVGLVSLPDAKVSRRQQKAEIIRNKWMGNRAYGKNGQTQQQSGEADDGNSQAFACGLTARTPFSTARRIPHQALASRMPRRPQSGQAAFDHHQRCVATLRIGRQDHGAWINNQLS